MASIQAMTIARKKLTLPGNCFWGVKRNSQGKYEISRREYTLRLDPENGRYETPARSCSARIATIPYIR